MAVREAESADLPERARPCRNLFSAKVAIRRKKSNFVRNKIPYRHETAIPAAPRRCALHLPHGTCPAVAGPSGFLRGRLPHQPPDDALLRNAAGAAGRLPARIYQRRNGQRQYVGRRRDRAFDRSDAGRRSLPPDGAPAADRNRGRFVRRAYSTGVQALFGCCPPKYTPRTVRFRSKSPARRSRTRRAFRTAV